jgi:hypothetical protein
VAAVAVQLALVVLVVVAMQKLTAARLALLALRTLAVAAVAAVMTVLLRDTTAVLALLSFARSPQRTRQALAHQVARTRRSRATARTV